MDVWDVPSSSCSLVLTEACSWMADRRVGWSWFDLLMVSVGCLGAAGLLLLLEVPHGLKPFDLAGLVLLSGATAYLAALYVVFRLIQHRTARDLLRPPAPRAAAPTPPPPTPLASPVRAERFPWAKRLGEQARVLVGEVKAAMKQLVQEAEPEAAGAGQREPDMPRIRQLIRGPAL